jgi:hypothetical protein
MLPENALVILARNERWQGRAMTEPYECGWAREAVFYVRALAVDGMQDGRAFAQVQVSPDGLRWVDEGTSVVLPSQAETMEIAKVSHFGGWLRLAAELAPGAALTVIVSLHLKA